MSELILYTSDDGDTRMHLRVDEGTIWLSQLEIAELFQTTKHNISIHTPHSTISNRASKDKVDRDRRHFGLLHLDR